MNKALSGLLIVLGLAIAIVPLFTDCFSQGLTVKLANGNVQPMKCHWTALAEIGVGASLAVAGILNFLSKQKETSRALSILGIGAGTLAILFPTAIIGVCAKPTMICNLIMRPTLIALGAITIVTSVVILFRAIRPGNPAAPAVAA